MFEMKENLILVNYKVDKQMAKEEREKLRAERSETFKETVAKKSDELKNWFTNLGK
jgi:hypothetical protein